MAVRQLKTEGVTIKPDVTHNIPGASLIVSLLLGPETPEPITDMLLNPSKNYKNRHLGEEDWCKILSKGAISDHWFFATVRLH